MKKHAKKTISLLLILLLTFCHAAVVLGDVVETSPEEATESRWPELFTGALSDIWNRGMDPADHDIHFSLTPAGQEPFDLLLQSGDDLVSLKISVPGQAEPIVVQFGDGLIWVSAPGGAYAVDWQSLLNLSFFRGSEAVSGETYEELLTLLAQTTLLPAVSSLQNSEGQPAVSMELTGKQLVQGLVEFGDKVVASETYTAALEPISGLLTSLTGINGSLKDQWPRLREQLLAWDADFVLNASLILPTSAAQHVSCGITLTTQGVTYGLSFDTDTRGETQTLTARLYSIMPDGTTYDAVLVDSALDPWSGAFSARVDMPYARRSFSISGSLDGDFRRGDLRIILFREEETERNIQLAWNGSREAFTASLMLADRNYPQKYSLIWSPEHKELSVYLPSQHTTLTVDHDSEGRFTAGYNSEYASAELTGRVCGDYGYVKGSYTSMGRLMGSGEASWTLSSSGFEADAVLNLPRRNVITARLSIRENILSADLHTADGGSFSLNALLGSDRPFEFFDAAASGWNIRYNGESLVYNDYSQTMTMTEHYESESVYVIDVRYDPAYGTPQLYTVRTEVNGSRPDWRVWSTVQDSQGETRLSAVLEPLDKQAIVRVQDLNPMTIDAAFLRNLIR